ncbi:MAG TPA: DsrE family protein [Gammaproteobacteria bacterium]|nr:DsrE family protein [Gammaproteobacteria bacterium]
MRNMIKGLMTLALALAALPLLAAPASHESAQVWQYPVIQHAGGVIPQPKAALQPEALETYKAVFNLTKTGKADEVNRGLEHVARAVNVFAISGVRATHRKFDVVIHGAATDIVMKNAEYKKRTGHDNPNIKLLRALRQAGVKIYVCDQALAEHHIAHEDVNPDVTLSLSALSDLIILQQKGYVLYPL